MERRRKKIDLENNEIFQWLKSEEKVFLDKNNSKYTFVKYPYSKHIDLIYGDYLVFLGIDRDLKYCGIYEREKEALFDVKYNLRDALGLSWNDCAFKDISNIKRELIFMLNDSINEYVSINQEEFYDAVKDYEGYINKKNVEIDFINGNTNYKYSSNISDLSTDDILKGCKKKSQVNIQNMLS